MNIAGPTATPAAACVAKDNLWKDRQVLRVYFMNSAVLKEITPEMIMKWAGAWQQAPSAPQFEVTKREARADIRVKCSGS